MLPSLTAGRVTERKRDRKRGEGMREFVRPLVLGQSRRQHTLLR